MLWWILSLLWVPFVRTSCLNLIIFVITLFSLPTLFTLAGVKDGHITLPGDFHSGMGIFILAWGFSFWPGPRNCPSRVIYPYLIIMMVVSCARLRRTGFCLCVAQKPVLLKRAPDTYSCAGGGKLLPLLLPEKANPTPPQDEPPHPRPPRRVRLHRGVLGQLRIPGVDAQVPIRQYPQVWELHDWLRESNMKRITQWVSLLVRIESKRDQKPQSFIRWLWGLHVRCMYTNFHDFLPILCPQATLT